MFATSGVDTRELTASQPLTVTVTDVNEAPIFTSSPSFSVAENETSVGNVSASDQDSADSVIDFSLDGTHHALFTLTADGALSFNNAPDFENPQGGASDDANTYALTVTVTSGTGDRAMSTDQPLTVTVTDVNEAPIIGGKAAVTFAENDNSDVATYTVTNPISGTTYDWTVEGTDNAAFNISNGVLRFTSPPDYETQFLYTVTVKAAVSGDPTLSGTLDVTVNITDRNDRPTFTSSPSFSVAESDTSVGTVTATDQDSADTVTNFEPGGTDGNLFSITDGTLSFQNDPDFETPLGGANDDSNTYELTVTATSSADTDRELTATQDLTVTVTDLPTFYRQVRTWTGRTLNNDADVTLTTYGTWTTDSNPPEDAPDITVSEPTIKNHDVDNMVRKEITWTDNNGNYAYQFTEWYAPTEHREVKHWSDDLGQTTGSWRSNSNPSGAPNLGTRGGTDYRDNAGAGGTWVWEGRNHRDWWNPQTSASTRIYGPWVDRGGSHPDNDPPAAGAPGSTPSHEPSSTRQTETRPVTAPADYEYMPANGPTENPARIGIRGPQLL